MTTRAPLPALLGRHTPDAPVLVGPDGVVDAADVRRRVEQLEGQLPRESGEVLISCTDRAAFVVGLLAVLRRGLAVALPPNLQPGPLQQVTETAAVVAHLADDAGPGRIVVPGSAEPPVGDAAAASWTIALSPAQHMASVFTSGSTAQPRVVGKTARQLLGEAAALVETFEIEAADRVLATVPPQHIYGLLFGVLVPLVAGAAIVATSALHATAVKSSVDAHEASILVSTPAHLRGLEVLELGSLSKLRRVFSSGAALDATTAATVRDRVGRVCTEVLGSTETGGIAWREPDGVDDPAWTPLPGVEIDADEDGRLLLRSAFLPEDASVPHVADDRIELLDGGGFRHRGRVDDVVKVGGKRVSLRAIEGHLRRRPEVRDVAVVTDEAPDGRGVRICAIVAGSGIDPQTLRRDLLQWIDPIAVPRRFVIVQSLPRDPNGKLRRDEALRLVRAEGAAASSIALELVPVDTGDAHERRFEVRVPTDLSAFDGHFPGHPVLPGAVELEWLARRPATRAWPDLGALRTVPRVKFEHPVSPGDQLVVVLRRSGDEVVFELRRGQKRCAIGSMRFSPDD